MSRNADIRPYLVKQCPYANLRTLLAISRTLLLAMSPEKTIGKSGNVIHIEHTKDVDPLQFTIHCENKFRSMNGEFMFTTTSVEQFVAELDIYVNAMGRGDQTFIDMITGGDQDIRYAFASQDDVLAGLNAEVYSVLIRRHQNRNRVGSNNEYNVRLDFKGEDRPCFVLIKDMEFTEKMVSFKLVADTEIMRNALGGLRDFAIPTQELGRAYVARAIQHLVEKEEEEPENKFVEILGDLVDSTDPHNYADNEDVLTSGLKSGLNEICKMTAPTEAAGVLFELHVRAGVYKLSFTKIRRIKHKTTFDIVLWLDNTELCVFKGLNLVECLTGMNKLPKSDKIPEHISDFGAATFLSETLGLHYNQVLEWIRSCVLSNDPIPNYIPLYYAVGCSAAEFSDGFIVCVQPEKRGFFKNDSISITYGNIRYINAYPFFLDILQKAEDLPVKPKEDKEKGFFRRLLTKMFR